MNTTINATPTNIDGKTKLRIGAIILLSIALGVLIYLPGGWGEYGPAPSMTGKVISIVPASAQDKAKDSTRLGTVVSQRADGYQLQLRVYHATGNGCTGDNTLHLSDIQLGQMVTVRYWLDKPETATNPHPGHAVYIDNRC